jgi:hypothetical protein
VLAGVQVAMKLETQDAADRLERALRIMVGGAFALGLIAGFIAGIFVR